MARRAIVAAARTLFGNPASDPAGAPSPLAHAVLAAVLWTATLLLAITVPLTIHRFRTRTSD